jgi:hypothetical protein
MEFIVMLNGSSFGKLVIRIASERGLPRWSARFPILHSKKALHENSDDSHFA